MSVLAANPELRRNGRIQLRRGRLLAVASICAAVSLSFIAVNRLSPERNMRELFTVLFLLQSVVLVIGGSIYCLQSVQREKDQNTFDFQRITRQTPLQLALGKILGAPALMYFATLCMMPVALWAAILGAVSAFTILQMYVVLLLGSFAFHCLAVLVSMVLERGASAGAMFFFLWAIGMTAIDGSSAYQQGSLALHALGPFWAFNLVDAGRAIYPPPPLVDSPYYIDSSHDLLFGAQVPHSLVLILLYLTLSAWFLLALARNIKRDPSVYEIFRPIQAFALALYLGFIVLAFFRWMAGGYTQAGPRPEDGVWRFYPVPAGNALTSFLAFTLAIFALLGLTLLRNRERARRLLREFGRSYADWRAAIWPAPYLALGTILCGSAILAVIRSQGANQADWSLNLGILQVAFVAAWLARDFIYLQWMNLRRARRPLIGAAIFLVVFYACTGFVLSALDLFSQASSWTAAIFIPSAAFGTDATVLSEQLARWLIALALLLAQSAAFAWLQRRELRRMAGARPAESAVA